MAFRVPSDLYPEIPEIETWGRWYGAVLPQRVPAYDQTLTWNWGPVGRAFFAPLVLRSPLRVTGIGIRQTTTVAGSTVTAQWKAAIYRDGVSPPDTYFIDPLIPRDRREHYPSVREQMVTITAPPNTTGPRLWTSGIAPPDGIVLDPGIWWVAVLTLANWDSSGGYLQALVPTEMNGQVRISGAFYADTIAGLTVPIGYQSYGEPWSDLPAIVNPSTDLLVASLGDTALPPIPFISVSS